MSYNKLIFRNTCYYLVDAIRQSAYFSYTKRDIKGKQELVTVFNLTNDLDRTLFTTTMRKLWSNLTDDVCLCSDSKIKNWICHVMVGKTHYRFNSLLEGWNDLKKFNSLGDYDSSLFKKDPSDCDYAYFVQVRTTVNRTLVKKEPRKALSGIVSRTGFFQSNCETDISCFKRLSFDGNKNLSLELLNLMNEMTLCSPISLDIKPGSKRSRVIMEEDNAKIFDRLFSNE